MESLIVLSSHWSIQIDVFGCLWLQQLLISCPRPGHPMNGQLRWRVLQQLPPTKNTFRMKDQTLEKCTFPLEVHLRMMTRPFLDSCSSGRTTAVPITRYCSPSEPIWADKMDVPSSFFSKKYVHFGVKVFSSKISTVAICASAFKLQSDITSGWLMISVNPDVCGARMNVILEFGGISVTWCIKKFWLY